MFRGSGYLTFTLSLSTLALEPILQMNTNVLVETLIDVLRNAECSMSTFLLTPINQIDALSRLEY